MSLVIVLEDANTVDPAFALLVPEPNERVRRESIPNETNKAQKAPRTQSHACSPPSGNEDGSMKLGGAGAAAPALALGFVAPFSTSSVGMVAPFLVSSKLEVVSERRFCFSASMGDVSKVVFEPLAAPGLCGIVIMQTDIVEDC